MTDNIKRFGRLKDDGDSGDRKRTFIVDDESGDGANNWKCLAIEIDTDDRDGEHARAFKAALIDLWNSQPSSDLSPGLNLRNACEATLLFYSIGPWDEPKKLRWLNLTGKGEATTKALCDCIRAALAREDGELTKVAIDAGTALDAVLLKLLTADRIHVIDDAPLVDQCHQALNGVAFAVGKPWRNK